MSKTSRRDYQTIQIVKRQVVGELTLGGGDIDPLDYMAKIAMDDARDSMRPDGVTESHYEVSIPDLGTTTITIKHEGDDVQEQHSVEELQAMLAAARRRERKGKGDVAVAADEY